MLDFRGVTVVTVLQLKMDVLIGLMLIGRYVLWLNAKSVILVICHFVKIGFRCVIKCH